MAEIPYFCIASGGTATVSGAGSEQSVSVSGNGVTIANAGSEVAHKIVTYEKIALIRPDRREELLADLRERTGLDIVKVQVGSIDFLKDTAFLKVTYIPDDPEPNDIDMITKFKKK